jgi:hypothetical protein
VDSRCVKLRASLHRRLQGFGMARLISFTIRPNETELPVGGVARLGHALEIRAMDWFGGERQTRQDRATVIPRNS